MVRTSRFTLGEPSRLRPCGLHLRNGMFSGSHALFSSLPQGTDPLSYPASRIAILRVTLPRPHIISRRYMANHDVCPITKRISASGVSSLGSTTLCRSSHPRHPYVARDSSSRPSNLFKPDGHHETHYHSSQKEESKVSEAEATLPLRLTRLIPFALENGWHRSGPLF